MKEKTCPECGETFRGAGLSGHLRFKHGIAEKKIQTIHKREDMLGDLFSLVDDLVEIRTRKKTLVKIDESGVFHADSVARKLLKLLNQKEKDIEAKIEEVGIEISEEEGVLPS